MRAVPVMLPQCLACTHLLSRELGKLTHCSAFPEEIPVAILMNQHDHRKAYPGDNGIRFEPVAMAKPVKSKAK